VPDLRGVASSLESLAGMAVTDGYPLDGARLLGAAQAFREGSGAARPVDETASYELGLSMLTAQVPADLNEAWSVGRGLSLAEAVALATKRRNVLPSRGGNAPPSL
jgi:hypothetical protein